MTRTLPLVAAVAGTFYLVTLFVVPVVDRAREPLSSYPEDYASGPASGLLTVGYASIGITAVALAARIFLDGGWVARIGALFLAAGGLLSLLLAAGPFMVTSGVLAVAAILLFAAPTVVSAGHRGPRRRWLLALGIFVAVGFLLMTTLPPATRGIANRLVDVALGAWLVAFAVSLPPGRRARRASAA